MKLLPETIRTGIAAAMTAWVFVIGAVLLEHDLGRAWPILAAVATLAVGWIFALSSQPSMAAEPQLPTRRSKIIDGIGFAGFLLGAALTEKLLAQQGGMTESSQDLSLRIEGLIMGVLVMMYANSIPKEFVGGRALAMRRAVGWTLFLGGLAYALAWMMLPMAEASNVAMSLLMCATAVAVCRVIWSTKRKPTSGPPRSQ